LEHDVTAPQGDFVIAQTDRVLPRIEKYAETNLPTRHGTFKVTVFRDSCGAEHVAIHKGEIAGGELVLARAHSECFTSEVLGSLKCDCREQLEIALEAIAREGRGVVVYLRQEGRGIGLGNKIRAYALQEKGVDTIEANVRLGFAVDSRRYDVAASMLKMLGVRSVALMTTNPDKVEGLARAGIPVQKRVSIQADANEHSIGYLDTKREKMGHMLKKPTRVTR
jgi:GTP cyclohydrolase II